MKQYIRAKKFATGEAAARIEKIENVNETFLKIERRKAEEEKRREEARMDDVYNAAKELMKKDRLDSMSIAREKFASIPEWRDSYEQIEICKKRIKELKAETEKAKIAAKAKAKKQKKIMAIVLSVVAVIVD